MKKTSPFSRPLSRFAPRAFSAAALLSLAALPSLHAASGTWSTNGSGLWSDTANWASGTVADGSGNTAFFNVVDLTANATVHLDSARTIGNLNFADTNTIFSYTVDNNGSGANILTLAGTTPTITVATSNTATISAEIAGTAGLTKAGSGILILSGVNTYSGTTSISGGTAGSIQVSANSAFGSSSLFLNGANGGIRYGAAFNDLRAITFGASGGRIDTNGFDVSYSSNLSGAIGSGNSFTKVGNGTLTLSGSNTITGAGGINVSGGYLQIDSNARLGNGTGALTLNTSSGGIKFGASFNDLRAITLGNSGGTIDTNGFSGTISTLVSGGTGAFVKAGSGTLTLTANNTYTGATTVNAGTLLINGSQSSTSVVTVNNTGALGGIGTIAGVTTINSGGKLGALDGSGNAFTLSNASATALTITSAVSGANTGALVFELGSVANSDKIVLSSLTAGLVIGSGVLNFNDFAFTTLSGFGAGTYTLFDTSTVINGTLGSSLTGTIGGFDAVISLGDSNHDIILTVTAVPEPSTYALLLGGAALLFTRKLRRSLSFSRRAS